MRKGADNMCELFVDGIDLFSMKIRRIEMGEHIRTCSVIFDENRKKKSNSIKKKND